MTNCLQHEATYVLVCGGRDYADYPQVQSVLRACLNDTDVIVHGGARGADSIAGEVAKEVLGKEVIVHSANWSKYGRAAGPIRNKEMLDSHPIRLVIAFAGGNGTQDMVRRARQANIPVVTSG